MFLFYFYLKVHRSSGAAFFSCVQESEEENCKTRFFRHRDLHSIQYKLIYIIVKFHQESKSNASKWIVYVIDLIHCNARRRRREMREKNRSSSSYQAYLNLYNLQKCFVENYKVNWICTRGSLHTINVNRMNRKWKKKIEKEESEYLHIVFIILLVHEMSMQCTYYVYNYGNRVN